MLLPHPTISASVLRLCLLDEEVYFTFFAHTYIQTVYNPSRILLNPWVEQSKFSSEHSGILAWINKWI